MTGPEFTAALKALKLRQVTLAEQLGVSTYTVNRWASGRYAVPKYAEVILSLMAERATADRSSG